MARDVEKTTPFVKERGKPAAARSVPHMFSNFEAAKNRKIAKWAVPLLAGMAVFHAVLFFSMWAKTTWDIEQLDRPKGSVDLAIAPPPPPPPPPPKGGVKPKDVTITPKKIKVRDIVQPVKMEKQEAPTIKVSFSKGERVKVSDGPFTDFIGIVDAINAEKGKVRVLVSFFGRETPVELDFLQVSRIT